MLRLNNKIIRINNGIANWTPTEPGPEPPTPTLPAYTVRVQVPEWDTDGSTLPSDGTKIQVSDYVWDFTYEDSNWSSLFYRNGIISVLDANLTGVEIMDGTFRETWNLQSVNIPFMPDAYSFETCFYAARYLTTVSIGVVNTTADVYCVGMFDQCSSLTSVPFMQFGKINSVEAMFRNCSNVESGALAMYNHLSSLPTEGSGSHYQTFYECGSNTQTGAAELAQIPDSWK